MIVLGEAEGYIPYDSLFTEDRVTVPSNANPKKTACILLSSSGTTGLPKAVQLSHVNIIANIMQLQYVFNKFISDYYLSAVLMFTPKKCKKVVTNFRLCLHKHLNSC